MPAIGYTDKELCEFVGIPYRQTYKVCFNKDDSFFHEDFVNYDEDIGQNIFMIHREGTSISIETNCAGISAHELTAIIKKASLVINDLKRLSKSRSRLYHKKCQGQVKIGVDSPCAVEYNVNGYQVRLEKDSLDNPDAIEYNVDGHRVRLYKDFRNENSICCQVFSSTKDTKGRTFVYKGVKMNAALAERAIRDYFAS